MGGGVDDEKPGDDIRDEVKLTERTAVVRIFHGTKRQ